mgnify:CR=1 FL=1
MPESPLPHVETLNDFFALKPMELSHEDLTTIVEGLIEQSTRWNAEANAKSNKRISSKKIPVGKNAAAKTFEGLKL